jgi:uncharacterized protein with NRDE domain
MCLILLSFRQHESYPLIVAANRDEFYERPTAPMHFWETAPDLLAGRDLRGGGTWLGLTRTGRFAAITNYRDPAHRVEHAPSRGDLVTDYLRDTRSPEAYLEVVDSKADEYNGFNLLVGSPANLTYYSNRSHAIRSLDAGLFGLSNHLLDTPWPKVVRGKAKLERLLLDPTDTPAHLIDGLLDALYDTAVAPDDQLPATGVEMDWERRLSAMHITTPTYGTFGPDASDDPRRFAFRLHRQQEPPH